ncbi:unnamed protein product [Brachionus calyciflorus]|uniref:HTH CENPB-type domain-containing protein n=1 Tax=Brachionus calyciflorus TaxID=104777 RepID=A0A813M4K6_9BILA|nr:unnamed protein product [Brachionus calyciflorus]
MARARYVRYSLAFKLRAIKFAESNSNNKASKRFKVSHKQIRKWIENKQKIIESPSRVTRARIKRDGTALYQELENELKAWIIEQRLLGYIVDGKSIKRQALDIARRDNLEFRASSGWFSRFLKRSNFVLRRITTSGRDLPKNSKDVVLNFVNKCKHELCGVPRSSIINFDETSIYLDSRSNYTYDQQGAKRVPATTSGNEKTRVSVCFAASASGFKFKPLIVIPRVNPLKNYEAPTNVIVVYNKSGVFNEDMVMNGVFKRCIVPKIAQRNLQNPTLIFDQATCHVTKNLNEYLAQNNINKIHIPKRFTNLLQPADVSWMRPLKRAYHERWQNWLINEERTFTPAGNIRSPGYTQVITWISEIWEQLDAGIIRDSFDRCGITSSQFFDFHSQLQAFLEKNQIDMIDDYDHADEVDGFVDDVNTNLVDSDSDSNSGSEGDSDIE